MDTCASVCELLNDYIDGTLGASATIRVVSHLRRCETCAAELAALAATRDLLRAADVPAIGASRDRVRNRFLADLPATETPAARAQAGWLHVHRMGLASAVAASAALVWVMATLPTAWRVETDRAGNGVPVVAADELPSASDIDRMTYLHAAFTRDVLPTGAEVQRDAFADANSRLEMGDGGDD